MNDFIFVVGAPGSRWSGVAKSIYTSDSINTTDQSTYRTYSNPDTNEIMHVGSYFDPGMEFGDGLQNFHHLSKQDLVAMFNEPFEQNGKKKIIKSHVLAEHVGHLDLLFNCPIVLVHRYNEHCMTWWKQAGGWDISYPSYRWYKNDLFMAQQIETQNEAIINYRQKHRLYSIKDNIELAELLGIDKPESYVRFTDCEVYCKI